MEQKIHINVTLDAQNLQWLDTLRGQSPRSTFLNYVLGLVRGKAVSVFDWDEESKKAEDDIKRGKVHKFTDIKKAVQWLKR